MSDYYNSDTIHMTAASYQEAIDEMLAITSRVVPGSNQYNAPFPTDWKPAIPLKPLQVMDKVTTIYTDNCELKVGNVIGSDFFQLFARWTTQFERCGYEWPQSAIAEYTDEDGYVHQERPAVPERISTYKYTISLLLFSRTWSAKDFVAKHDEVLAFMDAAPPKIRKQYLDAVAKADAEVARYNERIEKLKQL